MESPYTKAKKAHQIQSNTRTTPQNRSWGQKGSTMNQPIRELKRFTSERAPVSNLKYTKGSIIYAEFSQTGEFYMHNRRPLVVIGMPIGFYGKVMCCTTTSRNVPGIMAHFYRDNGMELGGYPISTIVPYNLIPVEVTQIINSIGQLNPWILEEVDNAVAFHLGFSDRYPGYCAPGTGFYKEHLEVRCSYGKGYYDPNEIEEEITELSCPEEPEPILEGIEEAPPIVVEEQPVMEQPVSAPVEESAFHKRQKRDIRRRDLISVLTDVERYELLIGSKSVAEFAKIFDIDGPAVSVLRKKVIKEATDDFAVSRIKSLLHGTVTNFGLLSNVDRAALTYYLPASILELHPKDSQVLEKRIILYMNSCGAKMRSDRVDPESFYVKLTTRLNL